MSSELYSVATIRKCVVNGIDIKNHVVKLYVSSSIFTPFVTAIISIIDGSAIQDGIYQAGAPVRIVYTAGASSTVREFDMVVMGRSSGVKNTNPRSGKTDIIAVSKSYFNMEEEYTGYHQNLQASEVMKKIHAKIDPVNSNLNILPSKGMIGSREAYHLRSVKLGQAANATRNRMTDTRYNSSAFVYFADQEMRYHCVPVEKLFAEASGPTFTQKLGLSVFDQDKLAHNIISMRKGDSKLGFGGDDAKRYYASLNQRGGGVATGFDWSSGTYVAPKAESNDPTSRATTGQSSWAGGAPKKATTVNHRFDFDVNQKMSEDFEGDLANKNMIVGLIMQGAMTVNVPLEGGMKCLVGRGCNLRIPSESDAVNNKMSPMGGKHLILAQGEYIMKGLQGMQGIAALSTSSGGTQGDIFT